MEIEHTFQRSILEADCRGRRYGHMFFLVGGECHKCGISQEALSGRMPEPEKEYEIPEKVKGMHSDVHAMAKEISEWCGEPKLFARYLGTIRRVVASHGTQEVWRIVSVLKDEVRCGRLKNKAQGFFYKTKKDVLPKVQKQADVVQRENVPLQAGSESCRSA